jgi:ribosomal protein S18 acetylase RimI-like enzyme
MRAGPHDPREPQIVGQATPWRNADPKAAAVVIRRAEEHDIPAMAAIRSAEWETQEYWERRISNYLRGAIAAQHALPGHAVFVADLDGVVVGFIAGHRTTRHGCQGELEWIDVVAAHRRRGIAGQLVARLAEWFVEQQALRICIDVKPENLVARRLYTKYGARPLNPHWMVWDDIRVAVSGTAILP